MTFDHILLFNAALLAAISSPGPALLVALRTTLSAGVRAGIAAGMGLGLMAATWTLMAFLGLEAVFKLFPWALMLTKIIGAAYLFYVAFKMWRDAHADLPRETRLAKHAFRQGIMVNALNPKAVLFAAAVLVVIFPANMSMGDSLIVVLNHLLFEWAFYVILALGMSRQAISARYLRAKLYIDRAASVVLGGLALRLILSRDDI